MTLKENLQSILESEIVPGGKLEELKAVHIEGMKLFPNDEYPLAAIIYEPCRFRREGRKIEIERNYSIILHVILNDIKASEELRDRLVLDENIEPMRGIIAVLLDHPCIQIGETVYDLIMGDIQVGTGIDEAKRTTAAAEIPITLKTWKQAA